MNSKRRKANVQETLDSVFIPYCFPSSSETANHCSENSCLLLMLVMRWGFGWDLAGQWRAWSANIQIFNLWQDCASTCASMLLAPFFFFFYFILSHSLTNENVSRKRIYHLHYFHTVIFMCWTLNSLYLFLCLIINYYCSHCIWKWTSGIITLGLVPQFSICW